MRLHSMQSLNAISLILRLGYKEHTSTRCPREAIVSANTLIYRIIVVESASMLTLKEGQRETDRRS
jgi:hypothetical protein